MRDSQMLYPVCARTWYCIVSKGRRNRDRHGCSSARTHAQGNSQVEHNTAWRSAVPGIVVHPRPPHPAAPTTPPPPPKTTRTASRTPVLPPSDHPIIMSIRMSNNTLTVSDAQPRTAPSSASIGSARRPAPPRAPTGHVVASPRRRPQGARSRSLGMHAGMQRDGPTRTLYWR